MELREAGSNHFHLSWYLQVPVVTSYGPKPSWGNFVYRVRYLPWDRVPKCCTHFPSHLLSCNFHHVGVGSTHTWAMQAVGLLNCFGASKRLPQFLTSAARTSTNHAIGVLHLGWLAIKNRPLTPPRILLAPPPPRSSVPALLH